MIWALNYWSKKMRKYNPNDVSECCKQMFQLWLDKCEAATWDQLIQALKEIGLNNLASTIKGMLVPMGDTGCVSTGK